MIILLNIIFAFLNWCVPVSGNLSTVECVTHLPRSVQTLEKKFGLEPGIIPEDELPPEPQVPVPHFFKKNRTFFWPADMDYYCLYQDGEEEGEEEGGGGGGGLQTSEYILGKNWRDLIPVIKVSHPIFIIKIWHFLSVVMIVHLHSQAFSSLVKIVHLCGLP